MVLHVEFIWVIKIYQVFHLKNSAYIVKWLVKFNTKNLEESLLKRMLKSKVHTV